MPVSFILVTTEPAREQDVYERLKDVKEIIYMHPLLGKYDFIIKLEANDMSAIGHVLIDKIRKIKGISATRTLSSIDGFS